MLNDIKYIDVHGHLGKLYVVDPEGGITPEKYIAFMDRGNMERGCILPIESPEECHFYVTTEMVLEWCSQYPDRLIPFCNIDPRIGTWDNSSQLYKRLTRYKELGCKGLGEAMSGLPIDEIRLQRVYAICGELGLPIIFHMDGMRNADEPGLPRLECMLQKFPKTIFVGHANHWWAEISGDTCEVNFMGYPNGPVKSGGAAVRLLADYQNMYADLSATSAATAVTRDWEFGLKFLSKNQDKLFFATDVVHPSLPGPNDPCTFSDVKAEAMACLERKKRWSPYFIGDYLRWAAIHNHISPTAFKKIARDNAIRVFGL